MWGALKERFFFLLHFCTWFLWVDFALRTTILIAALWGHSEAIESFRQLYSWDTRGMKSGSLVQLSSHEKTANINITITLYEINVHFYFISFQVRSPLIAHFNSYKPVSPSIASCSTKPQSIAKSHSRRGKLPNDGGIHCVLRSRSRYKSSSDYGLPPLLSSLGGCGWLNPLVTARSSI